MVDHVFRTDPQLGPPLLINDPEPWYDPPGITSPSYQLGQIHQGSDGYEYIWVKASADLTGDTAFGINDETFHTMAGSGWTLPVALRESGVARDNYFHARRATL